MPISKQLLGQIYAKSEGHCYYCGAPQEPFGSWEPDHSRPRSQGGLNTLENLVVACQECNRAKGGRTIEEYRLVLIDRVIKHLDAAKKSVNRISVRVHDEDLDPRILDIESTIDALLSEARKVTVVFFYEIDVRPGIPLPATETVIIDTDENLIQ